MEVLSHVQRTKAQDSDRKEMSKQVAQAGLKTALTRNVPLAAERDIKIGEEVVMFRVRPAPK